MDPEANLKEQLDLAAKLAHDVGYYGIDADPGDVLRLAALVVAMDKHLRSGGVLPREWQPEFMPPTLAG